MGIVTALLGSVVTFVVGLLVGSLAIFVAAKLVGGGGDLGTAVWTALLGSLAWAVGTFLAGWVPLLGGVLGLLLGGLFYLAVVNWQYRGGWRDALAIAALAWVAVVVARLLLGPVLGGVGAVGVPFA